MNLAPIRTAVLAATALSLAVAAYVLASPGFFIIDEVIYFIGADALARDGTFSIQNGIETFPSEDMHAWLLVEGPLGLTPQYPIGTSLLVWPVMWLLGAKSLIFANILFGLLTSYMTFRLSFYMFRDRGVALAAALLLALGTFWLEYVVGHWPHSISMFFLLCAFSLFLRAMDSEDGLVPALASGAMIGCGIFFRLEAVILLFPFGAILLLDARKPWRLLVGGAVGLLPFVLAMSFANWIRFDDLNPLSYGTSGGLTRFSRYVGMLAGIGGALVLILLCRVLKAKGIDPIKLLFGLAVVAVALLAVMQHALFLRAASGLYDILIDTRGIEDGRAGVRLQDDGTLLFWGLPKKALAQSLPWLGCLVLLAGVRPGPERRYAIYILTVSAAWTLPFVMGSWHGGLGSNMRYFLPVVPLLVILACWLAGDLLRKTRSVTAAHLAGVMALSAGAFLYIDRSTSLSGAYVHQVVSLLCLGATVLACAVAVIGRRAWSAGVAAVALGVSFGFSAYAGLGDLMASQERRVIFEHASEDFRNLPGPSVIYAIPEEVPFAFSEDERFVAMPDAQTGEIDATLIARVCASDFEVLVSRAFQPLFVEQGFALRDIVGNNHHQGVNFKAVDCEA
ncbi:glycosyltransferase family 39 protein [Oceanomicrobium pacificus]|uniref:Uncharacterized protein n=1 Tax=Oceanomicrobium pacificus TaxID=2692916 RepID=A0A6B0THC3_9RHOB|nr:glycosyltransferase family 39 protein [Oceanomicrobium pacificus]MXU63817.1 hypothetical protein [Oceanomicrobium pacificus]